MCRWHEGLTESEKRLAIDLSRLVSKSTCRHLSIERLPSGTHSWCPQNNPASSEPENASLFCLESGLPRLCTGFVFGAPVDLG
jgi:hypothetical protein